MKSDATEGVSWVMNDYNPINIEYHCFENKGKVVVFTFVWLLVKVLILSRFSFSNSFY